MERRLANLEGQSMQAPAALAPPVQAQAPPAQAPAPPAPPVQVPAALQFEDPCKRIKLEIPKFDGKDAEAWIINFERYCKIIKLRTDEDILLAMGIAMTGKATLWWHHTEQEVTTWQEAKEAVTCVYGDPRKKKDCANRLKNLSQGSMTISEFFVEVQNLNTYAHLDVETLPTFLEPGLNDDLRRAMEYMESLQPIDTYKAWKERALQQGSNLATARRKGRKPTTNNSVSGRGTSFRGPNNTTTTTSASTSAAAATTPKERKPRATQGLVPQEERDRRMAAGDCLKCGKAGHIGKNCKTGWRYDPAAASAAVAATTLGTPATPATPEIKTIERSRNRKRKQRDQAANDSGKD